MTNLQVCLKVNLYGEMGHAQQHPGYTLPQNDDRDKLGVTGISLTDINCYPSMAF